MAEPFDWAAVTEWVEFETTLRERFPSVAWMCSDGGVSTFDQLSVYQRPSGLKTMRWVPSSRVSRSSPLPSNRIR